MLASILNAIPLSTPERKTLLTPGFVNPGMLKRNLALKAGHIANLSVQPASEFFVDRAIPLFPKKAYVAGDRLFWLMHHLLAELKPKLTYFGDAVEFEGLCFLLLETISELRLNGIAGNALGRLPNTSKWNDVTRIVREYERMKQSVGLFDYADAVSELLQHPLPSESTFIIRHNTSALEEQLVSALGARWIDPEPLAPSPTVALSGYAVDTPYQEALQTIRNVMEDLRSATVPVRVGICTPEYNASFYHMQPVLHRLGQPDLIHWAKGEPLFHTPAGNLWKYLAEWVQNNFSIYRLVRLFESSSFDREEIATWNAGLKGQEISPSVFHYAVRYFRDSELVLFNADFLPAFRQFLEGKAVKDPENEREKFVRSAVDVALALAERWSTLHKHAEVHEQLAALRDVYLDAVRIQSDSDAGCVAKIEALIDGLLELLPRDDLHLSLAGAVRLLNKKLNGMYVNARVPDFTKPVIGTVEDLQYSECDTLYVIGLNEKGLPRKIFQNPILLDEEKIRLKEVASARFYLREDRLMEEESAFEQLTGNVRGRLVLSAPLKDLGTGRELLVSRYLLSVWNGRFGSREDYKSIALLLRRDTRSHNNHVVAKPEDAFYEYERGVAVYVAHQGKRLVNADLADEFPFVRSTQAWMRNRAAAKEFNAYWGIVRTDPARVLPVFSASRISLWTRCPYQYFLKYELGIDSYEDYDAHSLEWLDAMSYGSFMHDLLYKFFVRLREGKGVWFNRIETRDASLLWQVFDEVRAEYVLSHPVTSAVHYESQLARLKRDAELFLQKETQNQDTRLYVELAFHMPSKERREPLVTRTAPAVITLGDGSTLNVRGSIDRVDKSGGRHILYDYKTGRAKDPPASRPFDGGSLIQAGLYSEIIHQIDPAIIDPLFRFYFVSEDQGFTQYEVDYPKRRPHFLALLTEIVHQLRDGNFVPVVDLKYNGGVCSWCDFLSVCVKGKKELAEALKENDLHHATLKSIQKEEVPQGF